MVQSYQATSMQDSLKPGTLYNLPNLHQSKDWCGVTKRVNINCDLHNIMWYTAS